LTVVVCLLTGNTALARAPGNTRLPRRRTGLRRDSVVNASQIATLNRSDLEELAGTVPRDLMDQLDEGIRWFLSLD
jgi:mRNA interferase MazF